MWRVLSFFGLFILFSLSVFGRVGTLSVPGADIYHQADFDSEIVDQIEKGETFQVSKKTYNGFYKIKLKSGKIGFIPDHEVVVDGKEFQDVPYRDEPQFEEPKPKKGKQKKEEPPEDDDDSDDYFAYDVKGVTLQMVNYHESTMGSIHTDNLTAIGYRALSDTSFEFFASLKPPAYYEKKLNATTSGFLLWAGYGTNNSIPTTRWGAVRYGGSFMAKLSRIQVSAPARSYDMQDLTAGFALEGGWFMRFKKASLDFSVKYIFERNNYGSFGVALLF